MWMFLRGNWDSNNKQSAKDDVDVWLQLFRGLARKDKYYIWYKGRKNKVDFKKVTHVFLRGGHEWQAKIVKKCKKAFKIYYGAGKRYKPKDGVKYDLVLADSEKQLAKLRKKGFKAELWFKPAAECFKPVECEKKYDVCYVANYNSKFQEDIKRIKWVYKTVPKDLKMLHLGKSSRKPPKNVKVKKVLRRDMPKYLSQCKVGIVPYRNYDSAPRVIPEFLACGLPVICLDSVNFWKEKYKCFVTSKENFWNNVKESLANMNEAIANTEMYNLLHYRDCYLANCSMPKAIEHLRRLIK